MSTSPSDNPRAPECSAFQALLNERSEPLPTPPVAPKVQTLPFNELPWRTFEQLCCRLVALQPGISGTPHLYGKPGEDQKGIDIVARFDTPQVGQKVICFQCKNHRYFSPTAFTEAIQTATFAATKRIFMIASRAGKAHRDIEVATPNVELWDKEDLSARLKPMTKLVAEFFHPGWVEAFCTPSADNHPFDRAAAFCVPNPPETFVGRNDELAWVRNSLLQSRLTLIEGVGGIGKSALLQRALKDINALTTVWLNVESYDHLAQLETALSSGLSSLGFPLDSAQGQWGSIRHASIRIVLDGVDRLPTAEFGPLVKLVEDIINLTDQIRIVVISQVGVPWLHGDRLELKRLLEEDQFQLFEALLKPTTCPFTRETAPFQWLAEFADGHPLTTRLICALIAHFRSAFTVAERIQKMGVKQLQTPLLKEHNRATSLSKCLVVSYGLCSPAQKRLLCYISSHPSGCWSNFAKKAKRFTGFEEDLAFLRSLFLVQGSRPYSTALRLSMLHPVRSFVLEQFELDDTAEFLKTRMDVSESLMVQSAVIYLNHLNAGDVEYGIFRTDYELPNYLEAFAFASKRLKENLDSKERDSHLKLLGSFGTAVAQYFFVTGRFREGIRFVESGIHAHQELGMYESCASGLAMLGGLYGRMHDLGKCKEAIARLKQLSIEHPSRAVQALAYMNDGLMQLEDGHASEALTQLYAGVEIYRKLAEDEKHKTDNKEFNDYHTHVGNMAILLEGIGRALRQLNRSDEAILALEEAVCLQTEIDDRINIGVSLHQLGNTYADKGDRESAMSNYQRAIEIFFSLGYAHHLSNSLSEFAELALEEADSKALPCASFERDILVSGLNDVRNELGMILLTQKGDWHTSTMILRKVSSLVKLVSLSKHHALLSDWAKDIETHLLQEFFKREEFKPAGNDRGHIWLAQHVTIMIGVALCVAPHGKGATIHRSLKDSLFNTFDWMSEPTLDCLLPFTWLRLWLSDKNVTDEAPQPPIAPESPNQLPLGL